MKQYTHSLMIALIFLCTACFQYAEQPVFASIKGHTVKPVKLEESIQKPDNTIHLSFSGTVDLTTAEVFFPKKNRTAPCKIEFTSISSEHKKNTKKELIKSSFAVHPSVEIDVGEPFILRGSVTDNAHSVLDFSLPFTGSNKKPARLKITEVRPLYGKKPKSECIELLVMESGNLAGITLLNVGDKKRPHYTFPAAEVSKGEVVVYHCRSVEKGIRDEVTRSIISRGSEACPKARDFWGKYTRLPRKKANIIVVRTKDTGEVHDALLYCTKKEYTKQNNDPKWGNKSLIKYADVVAASGVWQGSTNINGAVIAALTPTKSLVRKRTSTANNADAWKLRTSKTVSIGSAY